MPADPDSGRDMTTADIPVGHGDRPELPEIVWRYPSLDLDVIVVYKVRSPTRSPSDFANAGRTVRCHGVSFSRSPSNSYYDFAGALTLNMLLSFARSSTGKVTSDRNRDKIAAL